jgi:hypothetical protein
MRFVLGLCALGLVGCSGAEDGIGEKDTSLVGGSETFDHPAVGVTVLGDATGCSATLVTSNVLLLAGHCFDPNRTDIRPWQFEVRHANGDKFRYETSQDSLVFMRNAGVDDIAILRLVEHVPPSVAQPIPLATSWPATGTRLELVGFGCTNRQSSVGRGTKRHLFATYDFWWTAGQRTQATCGGDSGGALLANGRVVGVISGYQTASQIDLFSDVPKYQARLADQIRRWQ